jgi:GH24 family phage-related lysozyme (muramidase)
MVESCLILTEERKPDMEWDFQDIKQNIDKSKENITTRGEILSYLERFFNKIKRIPTETKKKVIKYVLISFLGIMSIGQMTKLVNKVSSEPIKVELTPEKKLMVSFPGTTDVVKHEKIRKPSEKLYEFLKYEEGAIKQKGEPVLTAYDIGDGAITIGWGHAEPKGETNLVTGETTISVEEAEELLRNDVGENVRYLNNILDTWEKNGITPEITQGNYDAMVSMMFNMGVGNFRMSEFIQLVKQGKMDEAKEKIMSTHVTYPGHKPRREKETAMFGG